MTEIFPEVPLIRKASRQLIRELGVLQDQGDGMSTTQCHIMIELDQEGILTIAQLSKILQLDKSTTSRSVSKLEQQGYVTTQVNESDKRQKPLILTPEGVERVHQIHHTVNVDVQSGLELLSSEDRTIVLRGFQRYVKALSRSKFLKEINIRQAYPADNAELARIVRSGLAEFGADHPGTGYDDPEVDCLYETYMDGRSVFFVAVLNDILVGCGGIAPLKGAEDTTCELQRMYLSSEVRGQGLGFKMMTICLEFARQHYRYCYLETMTQMEKAQTLYRSFGFTKRENPAGDPEMRSCRKACNTYYMKELQP